MTQVSRPMRFLRKRAAIWLLVGFGLIVLCAANARLVYVAVATQPDCVAHLRSGEGNAERSSFSAANSACSQR